MMITDDLTPEIDALARRPAGAAAILRVTMLSSS
jgi:hypothetical protein